MSRPVSHVSPDGGPAPKRVLIVQTAFLGDVVLTLPLAAAAHDLWPDADLIPLTLPSTASVFENQSGVSDLLIWDKRGKGRTLSAMFQMIRTIRKHRIDLALIPHRSLRSALIVWLSGIRRRIGFASVPGSPLYTRRYFRDPDAHETARNLALLGHVGHGYSTLPELSESSVGRREAEEWIQKNGVQSDRLVALAPGSVWATKRWPDDYWRDLARKLQNSGYSVVIVGGPEDHELANRIADGEKSNKMHNAAGFLSVRGSAELIRSCELLITNDTAPLHLAVGVGTRVLAIFGPTIPEFGFAPIGPEDRVIGLDLECRGCAIHGSDRCPLGHHHCMIKLMPDKVFETSRSMLEA